MGVPNLRAIRDWCKESFLSKQEILDSKDSIESNNDPGKLADALVIKEVFQSVSNGKELIASAITGKGIRADAGDTFAEMADKITRIESSGESGGGDEVSFGSVSFDITAADTNKTINLSNYTDKYADISIGNGIFVGCNGVSLNRNSSASNPNGYAQRYTTFTAYYVQSTGILTIRSGTMFNGGCNGNVYYMK